MQFDPLQMGCLTGMKKTRMHSELQQLICATNWMRTSIPAYAKLIAPLHELMEHMYSKVGGRTKRAVLKLPPNYSWGATHNTAFANFKAQLVALTKLAHQKEIHITSLLTDASNRQWAATLTPVPAPDAREPVQHQCHEPFSFLSHAFRGASPNWSAPEKEGFAIVEAMSRPGYLVCGRAVYIFTDHPNLVYIFDPYGRNTGIPGHTASKLIIWAIKLSAFRDVIERVPGERNVWPYMLPKWAVQPRTEVQVKNVSLKSVMLARVNAGLKDELDSARRQDIMKSQIHFVHLKQKGLTTVDNLWHYSRRRTWIPIPIFDLSFASSVLLTQGLEVTLENGQEGRQLRPISFRGPSLPTSKALSNHGSTA